MNGDFVKDIKHLLIYSNKIIITFSVYTIKAIRQRFVHSDHILTINYLYLCSIITKLKLIWSVILVKLNVLSNVEQGTDISRKYILYATICTRTSFCKHQGRLPSHSYNIKIAMQKNSIPL